MNAIRIGVLLLALVPALRSQSGSNLRVIVHERDDAERVTLVLAARAGFAQQVGFPAGTAHMLEHLLCFQPLPKLGGALMNLPGSYSNAETMQDVLYVHGSAKNAEAPAVVAAVVRHFLELEPDPKQLRIEVPRIAAEQRFVRVNAQSAAMNRACVVLFGKDAHRYAKADLEVCEPAKLTPSDVARFRKAWVRPGRMILVVSGPITEGAVHKALAGMPVETSSAAPPEPGTAEKLGHGVARLTIQGQSGLALVGVPVNRSDPSELAAGLVLMAKANAKLMRRKGRGDFAFLDPLGSRHSPLFVSIRAKTGQTTGEDLGKELRKTMVALTQAPPSPFDVLQATMYVSGLKSQHIPRRRPPAHDIRARVQSLIGEARYRLGFESRRPEVTKALAQLDRSRVLETWKRWLGPEGHALVIVN